MSNQRRSSGHCGVRPAVGIDKAEQEAMRWLRQRLDQMPPKSSTVLGIVAYRGNFRRRSGVRRSDQWVKSVRDYPGASFRPVGRLLFYVADELR